RDSNYRHEFSLRELDGSVFCNGEWVTNGAVSHLGDIQMTDNDRSRAPSIFGSLMKQFNQPGSDFKRAILEDCAPRQGLNYEMVRETRIYVNSSSYFSLSDAQQTDGEFYPAPHQFREPRY
ncbi:hypothetical protein EBZ37_01810, partial [bacterium]|nr:hypothetical protein [bacterium]